jgi:hypothetical protein
MATIGAMISLKRRIVTGKSSSWQASLSTSPRRTFTPADFRTMRKIPIRMNWRLKLFIAEKFILLEQRFTGIEKRFAEVEQNMTRQLSEVEIRVRDISHVLTGMYASSCLLNSLMLYVLGVRDGNTLPFTSWWKIHRCQSNWNKGKVHQGL